MRSLFRDSSFVILATVANLLLSLMTSALVARTLGPAGKGELYLVLQIASLLALALSLGLAQSYQYHLGRRLAEHADVLSQFAVQLATIAFALALAYTIGRVSLRSITGNQLSDRMILAALSIALLNVTVLCGNGVVASLPDGVRTMSIQGFIFSLTNAALLIVFLVVLKFGLTGAVLSFALAGVFRVTLIGSTVVRREWRSMTWPRWKLSKTLIGYGLATLLGNLMLTSMLRIDVFILNSLRGPKAVGIYSVSVALGELMLIVPSAIGVALFPSLLTQGSDEQIKTVCAVARTSLVFGVFACGAIALVGYAGIDLLFGRRFEGAYVPLLLLLPGLLAMTVNYSFSNFFSSRGEQLTNAVIFGAGTITNIALNFALIPDWGIAGASVSSSITYALITLAFVVTISHRAALPPSELLFLKRSDITAVRHRLTKLFKSMGSS